MKPEELILFIVVSIFTLLFVGSLVTSDSGGERENREVPKSPWMVGPTNLARRKVLLICEKSRAKAPRRAPRDIGEQNPGKIRPKPFFADVY